MEKSNVVPLFLTSLVSGDRSTSTSAVSPCLRGEAAVPEKGGYGAFEFGSWINSLAASSLPARACACRARRRESEKEDVLGLEAVDFFGRDDDLRVAHDWVPLDNGFKGADLEQAGHRDPTAEVRQPSERLDLPEDGKKGH